LQLEHGEGVACFIGWQGDGIRVQKEGIGGHSLDFRRRQVKGRLPPIPAGGRRRLTPWPHAVVTEGAASARQWAKRVVTWAQLWLGLWAGPRRGASGQLRPGRRKRGAAPIWACRSKGEMVGWLGQWAKNQERGEENKGFPFSFMKQFCKFIFKRF
jgi:hypothetical protein